MTAKLKSLKRLTTAMLLLLTATLCATAAERRCVFVVPGYDYTAAADELIRLIEGDLAARRLHVAGMLTLTFSEGSHSAVSRVTRSDGALLYGGDRLMLEAAQGMSITRVRLVTSSNGKWSASQGSVSQFPDSYRWDGECYGTLTLTLGDTPDSPMRLMAIEVILREIGGGQTPQPVEPVVIEPQTPMIAPTTDVTLSCATPGTTIYYTTDGSRPDKGSKIYSSPLRLTVAGGTHVRAMAVAADGGWSLSEREYLLSEVGTLQDFIANDSRQLPVQLTAPLIVACAFDGTIYAAMNLPMDTQLFVPLLGDEGSRLPSVAPGDMITDLSGVCDYSLGQPAIRLSAVPTVRTPGNPPVAAECTVAALGPLAVGRYVRLSDVRLLSGQVLDPASGVAYPVLDRHGVVTPALTSVAVDVVGFRCVTPDGAGALLPVRVDRVSDPSRPEHMVTLMVIGEGSLELFDRINEPTLTPVGSPLQSGAALSENQTVYLYFRPDEGNHLAGAVVGQTALAPDDPRLESTPYGILHRVTLTAPMLVVATFAPGASAPLIQSDADADRWYTIQGRPLPAAPREPGLYIRLRPGHAPAKVSFGKISIP